MAGRFFWQAVRDDLNAAVIKPDRRHIQVSNQQVDGNAGSSLPANTRGRALQRAAARTKDPRPGTCGCVIPQGVVPLTATAVGSRERQGNTESAEEHDSERR